MKQIPITQGRFAIVDDEDFERIAAHSWAINPQGTGYAVRKGSKRRGEPRTVHMHREVLGLTGGEIVDHINGNGLDNRKSNLMTENGERYFYSLNDAKSYVKDQLQNRRRNREILGR